MVKIVQMGLGPLGQKVVRFALARGGIEILGAVDPDPQKTGKDLGRLCAAKPLGIAVSKDLKSAMKRKKAAVAVITTLSSVEALEPQIVEAVQAGMNVVSTCEELAYPWLTHARLAKRIDRLCRKQGVACVGTGVNPGFLMDYLPCVLSSVCQRISKIEVTRVQDASVRRIPFQRKIGAGLNRSQFRAKAREGTLRHVGLTESLHMIARSLNWKLDRVTETLKPVMAEETVTSGYVEIQPGLARGVEQVGRGFMGRREVIRLHFRAAVGEKESYDTVEIHGDPPVKSTIAGGVNGDVATCAIVVNAVNAIVRAEPGLRTMVDLPVPTYFLGGP